MRTEPATTAVLQKAFKRTQSSGQNATISNSDSGVRLFVTMISYSCDAAETMTLQEGVPGLDETDLIKLDFPAGTRQTFYFPGGVPISAGKSAFVNADGSISNDVAAFIAAR